MPATYTYPGLYVEEVPSGVRTIAGVSTAETAFIDFFLRGPVDRPQRVTSFADFERNYGGLDERSEASYAVQQYYLNGGQIAWIVRVAPGSPGTASVSLLTSSPPHTTLTVSAANPGQWGNRLQVAVTQSVTQKSLTPATFDLFVREAIVVTGKVTQVLNSETYRNLSMKKGDRQYCADVVNAASQLVHIDDAGIGMVPTAWLPTANGGAPEDAAFQSLINGDDGNAFDSAGNLKDAGAMATALRGDGTAKTGFHALDRIDPFIFNILSVPAAANLDASTKTSPYNSLYTELLGYCAQKRAFLIMDIPSSVTSVGDATHGMLGWTTTNDSLRHPNAAVYFPRLKMPDLLNDGRPRDVGPSGTIAGIFARTDGSRGVWKAPAGTDASLRNVNLVAGVNDLEDGFLNPLGINVLRNFPIFGNVSWGARTLMGADQQASEWKYIPVRRTALFIEESLVEGLKWVVFEPNDEPLWAQIRPNVGAFMHDLFRQSAFQGQTPKDAYFVKCDKETTTQTDIDRGIVNILVGFAPLKPAEFVVIKIQQIAGQIQT
jgi:phage tail sheath protein FI